MAKMNGFDWTALILVLVGAINWGLIGILDFNLVGFLLGSGLISRIVYSIVGLAGVYSIWSLTK